jgi:cytosine/adenosine deaminase-related metal-dependent hydrolase
MQTGLAVSRALRNHNLLDHGYFPYRIESTTLQAFNLATIGGARAVGMGGKLGRLQVGRKADIIVFDAESPSMAIAVEHDPLVAVVRHASVADIDTVIIGGKVLKQDGKLCSVSLNGDCNEWQGSESVGVAAMEGYLSWKQILSQLRRSRKDIQQRISKCNIDAAKEKVLEIWGNSDGGKAVLR